MPQPIPDIPYPITWYPVQETGIFTFYGQAIGKRMYTLYVLCGHNYRATLGEDILGRVGSAEIMHF